MKIAAGLILAGCLLTGCRPIEYDIEENLLNNWTELTWK
jgi:hypothetical protein